MTLRRMTEGGSGRTDVASMQVGRVEVELRGDHVVVDGVSIGLAPRERHVLEVLGHRPGCVVNKQELLVTVWNNAVDSHAVEVTVGRLRRRLEGRLDIQTVPRRGYRLIEPAR